MDHKASIDLSDLGHELRVDGEEVDVHTKHFNRKCDIVANNPMNDQGACSQFNDCFTWAFDWSSSQKDNFSKEPVSSNSESIDLV